MRIAKRSHGNVERGVTTVEGAIVLVVFFMLLLGVIEAGNFLSMRQVLTNAAREGARYAVLPLQSDPSGVPTNTLPNNTEIIAWVDRYLAAGHVTGATTTTASVSVVTGPVTTEYTSVTVTKPYSIITARGFFNQIAITLRGEALMRRETSQ
jgi:Flp pilus assembly protein TadG